MGRSQVGARRTVRSLGAGAFVAAVGMLPAASVAGPAQQAPSIELAAPVDQAQPIAPSVASSGARWLTLAASTEAPDLNDAERQDLEMYAKQTGEPLDAVLARQAHSGAVARALARIEQVAPGIVVSAELRDDGTYRLYVKSASPRQLDAIRAELAGLPVLIIGDRQYGSVDLAKTLPSLSRLLDAASRGVYEVSYDAAGDHFAAAVSAVGAAEVRAAYPQERDGLVLIEGMPVELIIKDSPSRAIPEAQGAWVSPLEAAQRPR